MNMITVVKGVAGELIIDCGCGAHHTYNPASPAIAISGIVPLASTIRGQASAGRPTDSAGRPISPGPTSQMGVVIKVGGVGMRTGIVSLPIASAGDIPATDADITAFSELVRGKFAGAASHFELDWQSGPSLPLSRIAERIGAQLRAPVEIEVLSHLPSTSDDK